MGSAYAATLTALVSLWHLLCCCLRNWQ